MEILSLLKFLKITLPRWTSLSTLHSLMPSKIMFSFTFPGLLSSKRYLLLSTFNNKSNSVAKDTHSQSKIFLCLAHYWPCVSFADVNSNTTTHSKRTEQLGRHISLPDNEALKKWSGLSKIKRLWTRSPFWLNIFDWEPNAHLQSLFHISKSW